MNATMSRRRLLQIMALTGAGTLVSGCGAGAAPTSGGDIALQLSWIKNHEFVGEYIAASRGYFTEAGLARVDLLAGGTSTTAESVLLAGNATVGLSSPPITASALVNGGAPLRIIGATYQKNPFAIGSIATQKPIRTPADLVGKRIGVQSGGNQTLFAGLLKANGIDASAVEVVGVQFDDSVLRNGAVDGFMTYVTGDLPLALAGYEPVILPFAENGLPFVAETFTVLQETIDKRRDALKAFLRAEICGWTDAIREPAEAARLTVSEYGKELGLDPRQEYGNAVGIAAKLIVTPDTNRNGLFTMTDGLVADTIKSLGVMGYPLAAGDLFDLSLLAEVYQEHPELITALAPITDTTPPA